MLLGPARTQRCAYDGILPRMIIGSIASFCSPVLRMACRANGGFNTPALVTTSEKALIHSLVHFMGIRSAPARACRKCRLPACHPASKPRLPPNARSSGEQYWLSTTRHLTMRRRKNEPSYELTSSDVVPKNRLHSPRPPPLRKGEGQGLLLTILSTCKLAPPTVPTAPQTAPVRIP